MNKKSFSYVSRQVLVGLIALQFLNLSIGSQAYLDSDYDYSYTYNKTYDPTETAVEWLVELGFGQKTAFSYNNHTDINKNIVKGFLWQAGCHQILLPPPIAKVVKSPVCSRTALKLVSRSLEIISPPPEYSMA